MKIAQDLKPSGKKKERGWPAKRWRNTGHQRQKMRRIKKIINLYRTGKEQDEEEIEKKKSF